MFAVKFWPIGLASRASQIRSKFKKQPHFVTSLKENTSPKWNIFFNRN